MLSHYYIPISILLAVLILVVFYLRLDKGRSHVRRLILVAVLTALSVLSRFAFAALPYFKPMTAIIILTGCYLGWEAGFLCGSLTALLSNIYFGQGPWTPFQMVALGVLGLVAALLAKPMRKHTWILVLYGAFAGVAYSFIMDIWTTLWTYEDLTREGYLASISSAVPVTIMYSLSNMVFLFLLAKPFRRKIGRMVVKYKV